MQWMKLYQICRNPSLYYNAKNKTLLGSLLEDVREAIQSLGSWYKKGTHRASVLLLPYEVSLLKAFQLINGDGVPERRHHHGTTSEGWAALATVIRAHERPKKGPSRHHVSLTEGAVPPSMPLAENNRADSD